MVPDLQWLLRPERVEVNGQIFYCFWWLVFLANLNSNFQLLVNMNKLIFLFMRNVGTFLNLWLIFITSALEIDACMYFLVIHTTYIIYENTGSYNIFKLILHGVQQESKCERLPINFKDGIPMLHYRFTISNKSFHKNVYFMRKRSVFFSLKIEKYKRIIFFKICIFYTSIIWTKPSTLPNLI